MTLEGFLTQWHNSSPTLEVRTSGSTGTPKNILVEKVRMRASARMTCDFLNLQEGNSALLCMPLDYIAGKMMVVRALERDMQLYAVPPGGHPLCPDNLHTIGNPSAIDLTAMVPLQVWNTLQIPEEREALLRIRHLIIGGGAIHKDLEDELRTLPINVWSSYGMTETLSHIALRNIHADHYSPLPGITLGQDQDGCLVIDAPALCTQKLHTNDIVRFIGKDRFQVLGRKDNTVCSGGIKIQIEEVEAWLRSHGQNNVMVTHRPSPRLGQELVYLTTSCIDTSTLCPPSDIPGSQYWLPRHIIKVGALPTTGNGKPDRAKAIEIAKTQT